MKSRPFAEILTHYLSDVERELSYDLTGRQLLMLTRTFHPELFGNFLLNVARRMEELTNFPFKADRKTLVKSYARLDRLSFYAAKLALEGDSSSFTKAKVFMMSSYLISGLADDHSAVRLVREAISNIVESGIEIEMGSTAGAISASERTTFVHNTQPRSH
jgi:hypothetical protein